jgi:hypothetical protein
MTTLTVTYPEYLEGLEQKKLSRSDSVKNLISHNERLKHHVWTDEQLHKIPTEELAMLAYEQSHTLQNEFPALGIFLAYWRNRERIKLERS